MAQGDDHHASDAAHQQHAPAHHDADRDEREAFSQGQDRVTDPAAIDRLDDARAEQRAQPDGSDCVRSQKSATARVLAHDRSDP